MHFSHKFSVALFFALAISIFSCDKQTEPKPPSSTQGMYDCHNSMIWDTSKIKTSLTGEWDWVYIGCPFTGGNIDDYEGLSVEFFQNGTLHVKQDSIVVQAAIWSVTEEEGAYILYSEPYISQIEGTIILCDDIVRFLEERVTDQCVNYFTKR